MVRQIQTDPLPSGDVLQFSLTRTRSMSIPPALVIGTPQPVLKALPVVVLTPRTRGSPNGEAFESYRRCFSGEPALKVLGKVLVLSFWLSCGWAAISEGTSSGRAENVTVVNLEEVGGFLIVTFSAPLIGGPECAAQHPDALVIATGRKSHDGAIAEYAFKTGRALKVWGGGTCKRVSGYATLSGLEYMQPL
jgi:hypothetical protein